MPYIIRPEKDADLMVVFKGVGSTIHIRALSARASDTISYCGIDFTFWLTTSLPPDVLTSPNMCQDCLVGLMGA